MLIFDDLVAKDLKSLILVSSQRNAVDAAEVSKVLVEFQSSSRHRQFLITQQSEAQNDEKSSQRRVSIRSSEQIFNLIFILVYHRLVIRSIKYFIGSFVNAVVSVAKYTMYIYMS